MRKNPLGGYATPKISRALRDGTCAVRMVLEEASRKLWGRTFVDCHDGRMYCDHTHPAYALCRTLDAWVNQLETTVVATLRRRPINRTPAQAVADVLWEACWVWQGVRRFLNETYDCTTFWSAVMRAWELRFLEADAVGNVPDDFWDPCIGPYYHWRTKLRGAISREGPQGMDAGHAAACSAERLV